jgi:hypothetical protein
MSTAQSFVPQIIAAYQKAANTSQASLSHAIKAGELLNRAKETVKAGKGKWLDWLKEHCPDIPQTTASLYMRLAANQNVLETEETQQRVANLAGEGNLGIRRAATFLPKRERPPKPQKVSATAAPTEGWTMEEELKNWAPDIMFIALKAAWERDELSKLYDLLEAHLTTPSDETAEADAAEHEPAAAAA